MSRAAGERSPVLVRGALTEVTDAARSWPIWLHGGVNDVVSRYRRTLLGPLWNVVANIFLATAMGVVWSAVFNLKMSDYLPSLFVGYTIWQFLMVFVSEGCDTFTGVGAPIMRNLSVPKLIFPLRLAVYGVILASHNFGVAFVVLVLLRKPLCYKMFLFLPAVALTLVTGISVALLVGMLSARFRDIAPLVRSAASIAFVVTPVIWDIERLGKLKRLAYMNPFTYFIEILRDPLLCRPVSELEWLGAVGLSLGVVIPSLLLLAKFKDRIIYWL